MMSSFETRNSLSPSYSQIAEIEAKMAMHEMDYTKKNEILNERIRQYVVNESELRQNLNSKCSEISSLTQELNQMANESNYYKSKSSENEKKFSEISDAYSSLRIEYDKIYNELEELSKRNQASEKKTNDLLYSNDQKNNEIQTLNLLIQKYTADLEDKENQNLILTKDNQNLNYTIEQYQKQVKNLTENFGVLQTENERLQFDREQLSEETKKLLLQVSQNEEEIKKLQNDNFSLSQQITKLQLDNTNLKEENESFVKQKQKFENLKTQTEKTEFNYNNEIIKLKGDISNLVSVSTDNISSVSHWIENYLCNLYSPNVQLPEININNSLENINFEQLKKSLLKSKKTIDNELSSLSSQLKDLKAVLTKGQDENYKLNKFIEDIYHLVQNEIELNKYFVINMAKFNLENDHKKEIEDMLKKVFTILKRSKLSQDEVYLNQLLEDNTILNNELKEAKGKYEKIYNDNISLDKKTKYLQQEIELKEAQINSQIEIIKRKAGVEEDNKKLVKDNIMLINKIKQFKNLQTQNGTKKQFTE